MIDATKIKSALVSTVIAGILAGAMYVVGVGDVFAIEIKALINVFSLAALSGVVSLIKAGLTTTQGDFVGAVRIQN